METWRNDLMDRIQIGNELKRSSDSIDFFKAMVSKVSELTVEEEKALFEAFNSHVNLLKQASSKLAEIEATQQYGASSIEHYREAINNEIESFSGRVIRLLDELYIKSQNQAKQVSIILFKAMIYQLTCDFYKHPDHVKSKIKNLYRSAQKLASSLHPLDPSRLLLALRMGNFYKSVDPHRTYSIVHPAIEAADQELADGAAMEDGSADILAELRDFKVLGDIEADA